MKSYKNSNDVITEPILQTLTGVELSIGNKVSMEARADISARGFWCCGQRSLFNEKFLIQTPSMTLKRSYETKRKRF